MMHVVTGVGCAALPSRRHAYGACALRYESLVTSCLEAKSDIFRA